MRPASAHCQIDSVDSAAVDRAVGVVPDEARLKAIADIFSALGDPTRLRILIALSCERLCVCDLAAVTGVSQSGVSHQLRVLRDLDLVAFERMGKRAVYRLADEHVGILLSQGADHAEERFGGDGR
ncbi:MAG: metalloregulator ArsR/SmtB family transcription factor [Actinomycetota bacterium]|jgi:DNA-binding transcriptional ArsR family regulator|nr:metalloregulator ArsR/SmtB family transcription factor [Actinomycetota bacterium]